MWDVVGKGRLDDRELRIARSGFSRSLFCGFVGEGKRTASSSLAARLSRLPGGYPDSSQPIK